MMTSSTHWRHVSLSSVERGLLRLALRGHTLDEAAALLGLPLPSAQAALERLQDRCGVPSRTRLMVLAILYAWV